MTNLSLRRRESAGRSSHDPFTAARARPKNEKRTDEDDGGPEQDESSPTTVTQGTEPFKELPVTQEADRMQAIRQAESSASGQDQETDQRRIHVLTLSWSCVRDLESDLMLGYVHCNRP